MAARDNDQGGMGSENAFGRSSGENSEGKVDQRVQGEIGKHLRAFYDDVINEPVPNRFMELLEQLERSTQKR
ncbi:hypothetical protein SAMN05216548_10486 [Faunimonas pinastri]|uniref:Anti-sigma factor NepR domain-containing protein n=2 Tax=Faunimonas pinastri TaxID=1855383 RepID=A0A1H9FDM6_9HYPH|nr:hypothetical protein SAMN05216548_10486 [Faunimonas pinastri]